VLTRQSLDQPREGSGGIPFAARCVRSLLFLCLGAPLAAGSVGCQVYDPSLLPDEPESDAKPGGDDSAADVAIEKPSSCSSGAGDDCADRGIPDSGQDAAGDAGVPDAASDGYDGRADASDADGSADVRDAAPLPEGGDARCDGAGCGADAPIDSPIDSTDAPIDNCPNDPNKTQPGRCGCGVAETDSDNDGTPDCLDACPTDPQKTQSGVCGCNQQDPPDGGGGAAYCFKGSIVHRYAFNGSGTVATDSIGGWNGTVHGVATMSGGAVALSGDRGSNYTNEGYVSLPSNILSGLTSATFETWVSWDGAASTGGTTWQRIFDIGSQTNSGGALVGSTYLFLTASGSSAGGAMRAAYSTNGPTNETVINAASSGGGALPLPTGGRHHVAVVFDDPGNTMSLYFDGDLVGFVQMTASLSAISDTNCWLGRSQFAVDPEFNGSLSEFRIYNVALNATQVQASFAAGPDPSYLP